MRRGVTVAPFAPDCRAPRDPQLAARMSKGVRAALSSRPAAATLAVHDDAEDLWCSVDAGRGYGPAHGARTLILETVLWRADQLRRKLAWFEARRVAPMLQVTEFP